MLHTFHKLVHPILLKMMPGRRDFSINILNEMPHVQGNRIFVMNHSNVHDAPIACESIGEQFYILVGKQRLDFIDRVFFRLNGVIYIDRKNMKSKQRGFQKMQKLLKSGQSLLMYPEGTWNMTPSKPMIPMNWGVIELAKSTGVPIIPLVAKYHPDCCHVKFGDAIYIDENADKKTEIERLEDIMATLKWDIWEMFPVQHRTEELEEEFNRMIQMRLDEYAKFDLEYEMSVVRER